jgi:hypothetical protein
MTMTLANLRFDNLGPMWLAAMLLAVVMVVAAYTAIWQRTGRTLTLWLMGLRIAAVLALIVAIIKPVWVSTSRDTQRPVVAVVLDTSQSMSLPHMSAEGVSRYERVKQWLRESPSGRDLSTRYDVAMFDITGQPLASNALPREPMAERTDLVLALRATAARLRGQPVTAALLVSDGQDNVGRESHLTLRDLPFDVHTIGFTAPPGAGDDLLDLALVSIDAPPRARLHNTTPIQAVVRRDGTTPVQAMLTLERGGEVVAAGPVVFDGTGAEQTVTLDFTPAEPGDLVLAARVATDVRERSVRNNTRLFRIRVDADPIRVLYVEGVLRNEYTFLTERLTDDPDVDLISFVRSAAETSDGGAAAVADELITDERLKQIDVVLLGDFEAGMLSESTYARLRAWVDDGGALMVLGGYRNLTREGLAATALADLLPVEPGESIEQIEQPFTFAPTDEGLRHPAMSLTGQPREDAAAWATTPMLRGLAATGEPRAAAVVLSRHAATGQVVLATQPFGKGTVAILTADSTWRWSRIARLAGQPDTHYARFWSQMVRWLAGRDEEAAASGLSLHTDDVVYRRGDVVRVTARVDPAAISGDSEAVELTARTPDGRSLKLTPARSSIDVNAWTAEFQPDRSGRFEIEASLGVTGADARRSLTTRVTEFQVEGADLELDNPWPDPSRLRQIASTAGGAYADIDDDEAIARLLDALPAEARVTWRTRSRPLWHSPGLFVLFVLALSVEWFVRRRHQLV